MQKPRRVAIMLDLDWPFKRHVSTFAGTQQYGQEHGWHSIMDEFVDEKLSVNSPLSVPYDGIIARASKKLAVRAARLKIPLVNVWRSSPAWRSVPGVFPDYAAAGCLRAEHLLSRGFIRFAAVTCDNDEAHAAELQAFTKRLGEAGYSCASGTVPLSAYPSTNWRKLDQAITNCMNGWRLPIGVFVGSERDGRLLAQMCTNRGWRVPEDVAIIAGKNEQTYCESLRPTLSSVEIGYERIGYEAAKLLDSLMDGVAAPAEPMLLPPKGLVVRESTDFFAVEDPLVAAALKFIAENCHKVIGQDDVASAVSAETRTLQRRFNKFLNRPIATEIRRVRIERAKRELAQGKRSLAEIANAVGFGEAAGMYDVFVRELGVTPSQYRRDRQTGDKTLDAG